MPVGKRLRKLRKSQHLTQAQVAEGINCTPAAYSRYETGSRQPSMETLATLAKFYRVSVDYLYGLIPLAVATLSSSEIYLINEFRAVPDPVKENVMGYLDTQLKKKTMIGCKPKSD